MSGVVGGKGSNSGAIYSLSEPTTTSYGGMAILNHLICALGDRNIEGPSTTEVNNFNADQNFASIRNPRNWLSHEGSISSYVWLYGPNYSAHDSTNGGWRIGIAFRVPVRIEFITVETYNTNARPRHFGLFMRPTGVDSVTNQTFVQHSEARQISTVGEINAETVNVFNTNYTFVKFDDSNNIFQIRYNNAIAPNFLLSFGNDVYNNGNANAGLGRIIFYGQALTN
tara:strand:+ start:540 stop:1217 length:678 start_codon:yes stop_codon:yes gene_type:complete